MTRCIFFLLFLFSTRHSFSQFYIRGRVIDDETQQPLKGASVYINNTTIGTTSGEKGEFELGPFSHGRYEVVASYVGYYPLRYLAEVKNGDMHITFKAEKKEIIMRDVLVLNAETRKRYLEIFKKYVLGVSEAAAHCQVKNIEELQFTLGESKDEIQAYTESELIIENPVLGYTLYFQLLEFSYNKATSRAYFYGYTRFVDWAKDATTKKKWTRNRKQNYEGSTVHFFRSLLNRQLDSEGFTAYQLTILPLQKRQPFPSEESLPQGASGTKVQVEKKAIEDSMIRLYSDSSYRIYELRINDGWRIAYAKNTNLKQEIMRKSLVGGQPPTGTISSLRLREAPVLISEKGILLTPINVYYDGIWSYERLANMLPEDYKEE